MTGPGEVERAVAEAHRSEWALVLAATACAVRYEYPLPGQRVRTGGLRGPGR